MRRLVRLALVVVLGACRGPVDGGAELVDAAVPDTAVVDARPPPCRPTAGGPYWIEEGQLLTVAVSCAAAAAPLRVGPLPDGAIFDERTGRLTWTPTLAQAGVYMLTVTVPSTGERAGIKIGVADRFDDAANMPVNPATYTEEYGLPVFHLAVDPAISDLDYTPATIIYRGHVYKAEAKYRGVSSLGYPKKSFTLKFDKADKFTEPKFPRGGFRNKRKVTLTTTFDDNSYVRQRLSFQVWNQLDPAHIQVQHYSAVVFLNGQYHGLYAVTDHIDGYLMEDHGLLQDGNLYKAVTHDANFKLVRHISGLPKAVLSEGYEKQEGLPPAGEPGAFADLIDLVSFVATSDMDTFAGGIGERINVKEYQDWLITCTAILARDSLGKNSYHYHDPARGPWRVIPWDFNASFGQTWQTRRDPATADPDSLVPINRLFVRFMTEPAFSAALKARYDSVLKKEISQASVLAAFEAMVREVDPCARRDERKWRSRYLIYGGWATRTDFTDFDGEVAYVRQWIQSRWAWLDANY
jgi:spore coat protein CotH